MKPNENLPKAISLDLPKTNMADTNRDIVMAFLQADGQGIELTDKQKILLERWTYADQMIRRNIGKKNREEIANLLKERWEIARATAYQDIINAEYIFSSSAPRNKNYLIDLRIEYLEKAIRNADIQNDFKAVAMLEKTLQKYIEMLPELKKNKSPRTLIFNVDARNLDTTTVEDAEFLIEETLKQLSDDNGS